MRLFSRKDLAASIVLAFLIGRSSVCAQGLGHLIFKGSHNSFGYGYQAITSQIDDWNVWFIELDIYKDGDTLIIKHPPNISKYDLDKALQAITDAQSTQERLTFLWFDIKNKPYEVIGLLIPKVKSHFGNLLYRPAEWKRIDGKVWPSYQELIARGKRYIAIFDEDDAKPDDDDLFMSESSYANATDTSKYPSQHIAFINRKGPDTNGITINPDDQYLWRSYDLGPAFPSDDLVPSVPSDWDNAADQGFNLLCANLFEEFWSFTRVQAPSPIVVDNNASGPEYGTFGNPAHSVSKGISLENIIAGTRVLIHAGIYDESPILIDQAMTLEAMGDTVEIK
jgi:hypothetical protein